MDLNFYCILFIIVCYCFLVLLTGIGEERTNKIETKQLKELSELIFDDKKKLLMKCMDNNVDEDELLHDQESVEKEEEMVSQQH